MAESAGNAITYIGYTIFVGKCKPYDGFSATFRRITVKVPMHSSILMSQRETTDRSAGPDAGQPQEVRMRFRLVS